MKHLLLDLTSDVLGHILSFNDLCHCSLLLWQCGSTQLQQKLAQSVRILKLENTKRDSIALPKFIASLRALRELTINRGGLELKADASNVSIMQQLPSSLEKLVFRVSNWEKFLLAKMAPQPLDSSLNPTPSTAVVDIQSMETTLKRFHSLQELELGSKAVAELSWTVDLPPTLTTLSTGFRATQSTSKEVFDSLPSSLTHIRLYAQSKKTPIPGSSLHNIDLGWHLTDLIPPSVTELTWVGDDMTTTYDGSMIEALPSSLTRFNNGAHHEFMSGVIKRYDLIFSYAGAFMPRLELIRHLSMPYQLFDRYRIQMLPSTLESFEAFIDWKGVQASDWPMAMKVISSNKKSKSSPPTAACFPASLLSLELPFYRDHTIFEIIPSGLLVFGLRSTELLEDVSLPPHLHHLTLKKCQLISTKAYLPSNSGIETSIHPVSSSQSEKSNEIQSYPPTSTESSNPVFTIDSKLVRCFPFHALPATLVELELDDCEMPFSKVHLLPPCLRTLTAELFHDADFNPREAHLYDRLPYLDEEARKMGFLIPTRNGPTTLPTAANGMEVTIPDLLPRTLTSLVLHTDPVGCLSRLPPLITNLHLFSDVPFSDHLVGQIPLKHLKDISMNVEDISSASVKAISSRNVGSRFRLFSGPSTAKTERLKSHTL